MAYTAQVGNVFIISIATTTSLVRHHAVLEPMFEEEVVSARVQAALKRRRLSLDTLHVVKLSLKMLIEPTMKAHPKGDFIDEKISGGKLISYAEMKVEIDAKKAAVKEKAKKKETLKAARAAAKEQLRRARKRKLSLSRSTERRPQSSRSRL
ncbi:hypothetical protein JG687_00019000 [Phytophthora cactorum]|uniref:Uncharacterized protein n=2 Tax=Phytophthora cactorum TaxID=29920 RepID=A0A8T1TLF8_9STRA|nr:hypothetical protein JG687_00019000 [Phytophthora cactorum]